MDAGIFENIEVRAPTAEEAKRQFLAAILRALTPDAVDVYALDIE